ncbi:hypothetical protein AVEN_54289-1 [Araneus ventricosus]|uniref:Uncharacterized protein n=1 Tax=Araneus ventricosus TaxID=182803 RepID=A0A4Y2TT59_ARAVE|nr:hypothetical protein AVEN_54289-1 [Araneus ventricosus]
MFILVRLRPPWSPTREGSCRLWISPASVLTLEVPPGYSIGESATLVLQQQVLVPKESINLRPPWSPTREGSCRLWISPASVPTLDVAKGYSIAESATLVLQQQVPVPKESINLRPPWSPTREGSCRLWISPASVPPTLDVGKGE